MDDKGKYDDSGKGGFSYAEKLALVSKGMMEPKEIGMVSADDAIYEITGLEKPKPKPFLGDWATFEVSVIPLSVQAKWARQELKVIPTNPQEWEKEWIQQHKTEFRCQAIFRSGACQARFEQTFTDPILGFIEMMRQAATLLGERYEQVKQENPEKPIKTREEIDQERRDAASKKIEG